MIQAYFLETSRYQKTFKRDTERGGTLSYYDYASLLFKRIEHQSVIVMDSKEEK
ncbi:hypothetical protein [Enterococcus hirae]|uniref:hypothetical protein n=1 Tax=Enterococcus hirae TaxID=1354 RepID=UPI001A967B7E|nr:hypothetical protein [Enterococcus hirae]